MTGEIKELIDQTIALTQAPPPALLAEDAPTLADRAISENSFYLIGLIGGKDVGKSALVNALVGQSITQTTSFGPGTQSVIAYAHESQLEALKPLLHQIAGGEYRIVSHRNNQLARQVLLDLPDIDSHWQSHVQLTRKMLRHMLFPIWVQSIEKYADQQPQQLLAAVAQGNDASNFIFCLNKADQLADAKSVEELRADYARRLRAILHIAEPRVWMVSAAKPDEFDLPELRRLLSSQKTTAIVRQSQSLAETRQNTSAANWLQSQDLLGRADRLERLEREAQEILNQRLSTDLLERVIVNLMDDPASRLALTDQVLAARLRGWPIVNIVHSLISPILAVVRRNVGTLRTSTLPEAEAMVDAHFNSLIPDVPTRLRDAFAHLQQSDPTVSELFARRKLWDDLPAAEATQQLRQSLVQRLIDFRDQVRQHLGRCSVICAPLRWLLTIGALLWFPLLQPITQEFLDNHFLPNAYELTRMLVQLISVQSLLSSVSFLILYFLLLWIILRWHTQRRVDRLIQRWKSDASPESLTATVMTWIDELLAPLQERSQQMKQLADKAERFISRPPASIPA